MLSPLVSVIIPVYNVKPYLREALDSVINQTYRNLEIIIVDDGSTDGSGRICDQYQKKDHRIRVIHQQNKGLSGARNAGLDVMHGEIVSFLDPDDAFLPEMIELLVKNMIKLQADISACGFYTCRTAKRLSASRYESIVALKHGCVNSTEALRLMLDNQINIAVWNKLYRKNLFVNLRFPEGYVFEDQLTTPFLLERAKNIVMLKQPLLLHRIQRPGSITATFSEKNARDWLYATKKKAAFILKHTPSVFEPQQVTRYNESFFRGLLWHYARVLSFSTVTKETKRIFEQEITNRAKDIQKYSMKTKIVYWLYRIDPRLLYLSKRSYSAVRKTLKHMGQCLRRSHG